MSAGSPAYLPHIGLLFDDVRHATLTATLADLTSVSAGVTGGIAAPASLPSLSLVLYDAGILGTVSKTLEALTSSSAVSVVVGCTLTKTLAPVTLDSDGTAVFIQGSIDAPVSLPHFSLVLYPILGIVGNLVQTLEDATLISEVDAPGNEIWPYEDEDRPQRAPIYWPHAYNVDWFQTDTVLRSDTGGIFGVVGQDLQPIITSLAGAVGVDGTLAQTLEDLTADSDGTVDVVGTLTKTLDSLAISSTASVFTDYVGTLFATFDALTSVSEGTVEVAGTLSQTLEDLTCDSDSTNEVTGTLDRTLQGINAEITGSVLDDIVCVVNQFLDAMICRARIGEDAITAPRPTGGWPVPKRKKKYYEALPTEEEVEEERIRLGILPKKVQKAVAKVIAKASGVQTPEQATTLAAAYFEEEMQRRLLETLRKEIASAKSKWQDEVFTVAHAMILDELQKRADHDALQKILADKAQEEEEIADILDLWLTL